MSKAFQHHLMSTLSLPRWPWHSAAHQAPHRGLFAGPSSFCVCAHSRTGATRGFATGFHLFPSDQPGSLSLLLFPNLTTIWGLLFFCISFRFKLLILPIARLCNKNWLMTLSSKVTNEGPISENAFQTPQQCQNISEDRQIKSNICEVVVNSISQVQMCKGKHFF